jgi:hypothetical protein
VPGADSAPGGPLDSYRQIQQLLAMHGTILNERISPMAHRTINCDGSEKAAAGLLLRGLANDPVMTLRGILILSLCFLPELFKVSVFYRGVAINRVF